MHPVTQGIGQIARVLQHDGPCIWRGHRNRHIRAVKNLTLTDAGQELELLTEVQPFHVAKDQDCQGWSSSEPPPFVNG